jgi:hypothetical protein
VVAARWYWWEDGKRRDERRRGKGREGSEKEEKGREAYLSGRRPVFRG